jgi:hypothetical protein
MKTRVIQPKAPAALGRAHGQISVRFLNETEALYHFDID